MNNYEKIKNMIIEELAEFITSLQDGICIVCNNDKCQDYCFGGISQWLESEVNKNVEN